MPICYLPGGEILLKVAITGANGFVGSRLTRFLMNHGHDVTALVRASADVSLLPVKSKIVSIDYNQADEILRIFEGFEIIIHCAAIVRSLNWDDMHSQNTLLTQRIVEAVNNCSSISQIVFLSSQAAAGMGERNKPRIETDPPKPITWYGKSKLMAEDSIRSHCHKDWTIIRPCSVYGPGDKDFLHTFRLMKNHLSFSLGWMEKHMSLIYVDELCSMINLSLGNEAAFKQTFFASDGGEYTHKDFMEAMQTAVQTVSLHISLPDFALFPIAALGEIRSRINHKAEVVSLQKFKELKGRYWIVNIDKSRKLLGYHPKPNLSKNLHSTWVWYKEQGWL